MSPEQRGSTAGVTKALCDILSGMVHIKELLLLTGKSSPCGSSGVPLLLYIYIYIYSGST